MENASKALIMAGSVLIALLIIGALVLMFRNLTNYQKTNSESTLSSQIIEYNQQFETYNRKKVRGSELYSLLNRIIDYNRRQSSDAIGTNYSGADLQYEPMEINFKIDITKLSATTDKNRLFTTAIQTNKDTYTVSKLENSFEKSIKKKIDDLENAYGQESLTNLTTNLTKLFKDTEVKPGSEQETVLVKSFNEASSKVKIKSYSDIDSKSFKGKYGDTIREDAYTYYEYIQFKRAYFDCKDVEYDEHTGRITRMDFEFTGKFN